MHITFYGAVREVTGSMHLLTSGPDKILLDCGMYQGRRKETDRKNRTLPFDPKIITNAILSHAHIDHSGRIPLLTRNDFSGRVISTRATADACSYLLPDSAHIQESDADYLNYKMVRSLMADLRTNSPKGAGRTQTIDDIRKLLKKEREGLNTELIGDVARKYRIDVVEPLYTTEDAQHALTFFDGIPYKHNISIGQNTSCTLYEAGHILGSAISIIHTRTDGRDFTVGFTGDIGRFGKPIIKDPTLQFAEEDRDIDLMILESTYGDRDHDPVVDLEPQLKQVINETVARGGTLLIPSFAFGRTQELLYVIHSLYNANAVPRLPVYVDSPLATKITEVFGEHPEVYDIETHNDFLKSGDNPFFFKELNFTASVQESMDLMREKRPHIVISASGMCEAGRILHHLRHKIHQPENTILIVGYMAQHTLGRRLLEQGLDYEASGRSGKPPIMRFMNKTYPLKARVVKLGGFSAHGDRHEMLRFLTESNLKVRKIALVHGEEEQTLAFADFLKGKGFDVFVPRAGESLALG